MGVRRLVGDPEELTRLDAEPLSEGLDDARPGKAIEDVLARMAQALDAVIRSSGDLPGADHAEGASRPSRLGDAMQTFEERCGHRHARFIQTWGPLCPFSIALCRPSFETGKFAAISAGEARQSLKKQRRAMRSADFFEEETMTISMSADEA